MKKNEPRKEFDLDCCREIIRQRDATMPLPPAPTAEQLMLWERKIIARQRAYRHRIGRQVLSVACVLAAIATTSLQLSLAQAPDAMFCVNHPVRPHVLMLTAQQMIA